MEATALHILLFPSFCYPILSCKVTSYYFQKCLKNMGIEDKLKELGVCEGDTVKISDWELEWMD